MKISGRDLHWVKDTLIKFENKIENLKFQSIFSPLCR